MRAEEFKSAELKARLAEASATIDVARRALDDGKVVSLDGLEAHVEITCKGITTLPKAESEELQPPMLALIDSLEQLASALGKDHRETEDALNTLTDRQRAQSAYAKSSQS